MIGGQYNPFDLEETFGVSDKAFKTVCRLISEEHKEVESLTTREVYECDRVVEKLNLDRFRSRYFARSRCGDETYQYYDLLVTELP
jgi:hypothetical protein